MLLTLGRKVRGAWGVEGSRLLGQLTQRGPAACLRGAGPGSNWCAPENGAVLPQRLKLSKAATQPAFWPVCQCYPSPYPNPTHPPTHTTCTTHSWVCPQLKPCLPNEVPSSLGCQIYLKTLPLPTNALNSTAHAPPVPTSNPTTGVPSGLLLTPRPAPHPPPTQPSAPPV